MSFSALGGPYVSTAGITKDWKITENSQATSLPPGSWLGFLPTSVQSAVVHGWERVAPGDGGCGRDGSAAFTDWGSLLRAAPSRCFCLAWLGRPGWGSDGRVPGSGHCHGIVVLVQCERPRDLVG